MRKTIFSAFLILSGFFAQAQSAVTPQDVCDAAIGFLNQFNGPDAFKKGLGEIYKKETSYGMEFREYYCKQDFPGAKRTIIIDSTKLNRYRSAKVLMFSEITKTDGLTKDAVKFFDLISEMLGKCLKPQKFEEDLSPQLIKQHLIKMSYNFEMPSKGGVFSNMQSGNTQKLEIYIDQQKNTDGTFTNEVYLHFKRV